MSVMLPPPARARSRHRGTPGQGGCSPSSRGSWPPTRGTPAGRCNPAARDAPGKRGGVVGGRLRRRSSAEALHAQTVVAVLEDLLERLPDQPLASEHGSAVGQHHDDITRDDTDHVGRGLTSPAAVLLEQHLRTISRGCGRRTWGASRGRVAALEHGGCNHGDDRRTEHEPLDDPDRCDATSTTSPCARHPTSPRQHLPRGLHAGTAASLRASFRNAATGVDPSTCSPAGHSSSRAVWNARPRAPLPHVMLPTGRPPR